MWRFHRNHWVLQGSHTLPQQRGTKERGSECRRVDTTDQATARRLYYAIPTRFNAVLPPAARLVDKTRVGNRGASNVSTPLISFLAVGRLVAHKNLVLATACRLGLCKSLVCVRDSD